MFLAGVRSHCQSAKARRGAYELGLRPPLSQKRDDPEIADWRLPSYLEENNLETDRDV